MDVDVMDDFKEFHSRVWVNAMEAAEQFEQLVFLPNGQTARAVLVNDLVALRAMPGWAKGEI
jgi:hypothetical protein